MRARNEFDHYNTLKLEDRVFTSFEVQGMAQEFLNNRIRKIVRAASEKLKDQAISISERLALLKIANEGILAIKAGTKAALVAFYLGAYPDAVAEGSHKDLNAVEYYDYVVDPKEAVTVNQQTIVEQIQTTSDFAMDTPRREYDMRNGMGGMGDVAPTFFQTNKEKIILGVGALALGALGYHVFIESKKRG